MESPPERVAELEWANYAATLAAAEATPGLEVVLRDDVILTTSATLPTHDANHACLLRTTPDQANALLDEIVDTFDARDLPAAVFLSPACAPEGLADRLLARGFEKEEQSEAWLVVDDMLQYEIPTRHAGISVRAITQDETAVFAEVFLAAFGLPGEFAPLMAQLLAPSVDLPNTTHYLALEGDRPIGTSSLVCHETFGVLGSAGVVPDRRQAGAATNLGVQALTDARERGIRTVMMQTTADTWLERFVQASGFRRAFTRTCYCLER